MSTPNKTDKTTQGLRLVSYCPVCEIRSKSMNARTLAAQGETKLMHIQCHKCQNAFLALVLVNQVGASSVGLLTDLAYDDVVRFRSHADVSVNDVIGIHEQLEQGLFPVTFEKPRKTAVKKVLVKKARKKLGK
ncbi:MAG: hypothetical protein NTX72_05725 [Candidatus Uhrbacteria bacterium]|nr:hypothetical protein [Candidatus Uhrbacteria bacterium]